MIMEPKTNSSQTVMLATSSFDAGEKFAYLGSVVSTAGG